MTSQVLDVEVDGASLHVVVTGTDGPYTVVPHPFQWMDGADLRGILSSTFRGVVVHPRGCGESTGGDLSTGTLVTDLDAVRGALGAETWLVWGQSAGGTVAMLYAHQFPGATKGLILSCTAASRLDSSSVFHPANPDNAVANSALARGDRNALTPLICHRPEAVLARNRLGGECPERMAFYRTEARADLLPLLPRMGMPALVIGGRHDRAIPLSYQREIAAALPNAQLVEFEQSGHFPYIEEPDRFKDVLVEFAQML